MLISLMLDNIKTVPVARMSSVNLLTQSLRHIWSSGYQHLLVPVTVYRGLAPSFLIGDFTAVCIKMSAYTIRRTCES